MEGLDSFIHSEVNNLFKIQSYINKPDKLITDLQEIILNPQNYFINVENTIELLEVTKQLDFNYLNGVIYLEYIGQPLMDYSLWDLVDQLWEYILNVIEDFLKTSKGSTYFPDQPLKLEIIEISNEILLFQLDEGNMVKCILPKKEFLNSILEGAEKFYLNMHKAFSKHCDYSIEMRKIDYLRKLL